MAIPLTLSDSARARIRELCTRANNGAMGLKVGINNKGCAGHEYQWELVTAEPAGCDRVDVAPGVALYVPMMDSMYLFGATLDFVTDDLGNSKFDFLNPNEADRCGCGESISFASAKS